MQYTAPDKDFIRKAFNAISPRYDLLNQVLSFGQADRWRKRACQIFLEGAGSISEGKRGQVPFSKGLAPFLKEKVPVSFYEKGARPQSILDLGCGTGDSLKWFLRARKWERAVGLDFSKEMLVKARLKLLEAEFREGDFNKLPFGDAEFDLVFSAFTLRSVQNMPQFLSEVKRVLKPGGRTGLLELTRPRNFLHRAFFFPYIKVVLPALGRLVSGNDTAYRFLSQSVENFQVPEQTLEIMRQADFRDLFTKSFSFGVATLIIATK